jgi:hypothetical protein
MISNHFAAICRYGLGALPSSKSMLGFVVKAKSRIRQFGAKRIFREK